MAQDGLKAEAINSEAINDANPRAAARHKQRTDVCAEAPYGAPTDVVRRGGGSA